MKEWIIAGVALALLAGAPAGAASPAPHRPAAVQDRDDPFAGAWSEAALEHAAAAPMAAYRAHGFAAGVATLEAILAAEADPAERARLLTAFGVNAIGEGADYIEVLPLLRRAAEEGRLGLPADSRRLAMLLADAAITEFEALGERTSPGADALLLEAYRIRLARLGSGHMETLSSLVYLADIQGQPGRLGDDPERIAAVARLYEPLLSADPPQNGDDLTPFFISWARFHVRTGSPEAACAVVDKINALADRLRLDARDAGLRIGQALEEAGYTRQAAPLRSPGASKANRSPVCGA